MGVVTAMKMKTGIRNPHEFDLSGSGVAIGRSTTAACGTHNLLAVARKSTRKERPIYQKLKHRSISVWTITIHLLTCELGRVETFRGK